MSASADVERAVGLIEHTIRDLGIDPAASRTQREGHVAFALRRGSARILIAVHSPTDELKEGRLRVVAPVVQLPAPDRLPELCRELLEANASKLVGAAFALSGEEVVVVTARSGQARDGSEVDGMIRTVGRLADAWDDALAERYGARRSSDA